MRACLAAIAASSLLVATPSAIAQKVYKCGSSYSQVPCPAGTVIEVDDARSAGQKKQTDDAARRDARLADDMEKARLKQDALAAPALVVGTSAQPGDTPAKPGKRTAARKKGPKKQPEDFTATDGKTKATEKKRAKP